jgi:hypothetical protein
MEKFFRIAAIAAKISGPSKRPDRTSILKKKFREEKDRSEWALFDSKGKKVLKWFGPEKPSKERVQKEERRIQFFKHKKGSNINIADDFEHDEDVYFEYERDDSIEYGDYFSFLLTEKPGSLNEIVEYAISENEHPELKNSTVNEKGFDNGFWSDYWTKKGYDYTDFLMEIPEKHEIKEGQRVLDALKKAISEKAGVMFT